MKDVVRPKSKKPTIDRRLWRIDRRDRNSLQNGIAPRTVVSGPCGWSRKKPCAAYSGSRLSRKHRAIRRHDPSAF